MKIRKVISTDNEVYYEDAVTGEKIEVEEVEEETEAEDEDEEETSKYDYSNLGNKANNVLKTIGIIIAILSYCVAFYIYTDEHVTTNEKIMAVSSAISGSILCVMFYVISGIGDTVLSILEEIKEMKENKK